MVNDDTVKLLKECSTGIKIAVLSLEKIISKTKDKKLKACLKESVAEHNKLKNEIDKRLSSLKDKSDKLNVFTELMIRMEVLKHTGIGRSDFAMVKLTCKGAIMGKKTLRKYLKKYRGADLEAKETVLQLTDIETKLYKDLKELYRFK